MVETEFISSKYSLLHDNNIGYKQILPDSLIPIVWCIWNCGHHVYNKAYAHTEPNDVIHIRVRFIRSNIRKGVPNFSHIMKSKTTSVNGKKMVKFSGFWLQMENLHS